MSAWEKILIDPSTTILNAIKRLDGSGEQILIVVDEKRRLLGTVTDCDIRRGILRSLALSEPVERVMKLTPRTAPPDAGKKALLEIMTGSFVHQIPLVNAEGCVVGLATMEENGGGCVILLNI